MRILVAGSSGFIGQNLMSYLQTKFVNHVLSIRKISQHINIDVCKWIPVVPFDRIWTDDLVCEYLGITRDMYEENNIIKIEDISLEKPVNNISKSLQDLTITELKNIARREGVKAFSKYTKKNKNELVEKIQKHREDK